MNNRQRRKKLFGTVYNPLREIQAILPNGKPERYIDKHGRRCRYKNNATGKTKIKSGTTFTIKTIYMVYNEKNT
jgi:hypothetical protein